MESKPDSKWKAASAQTLLWCCFCDARFERPALLSSHLDRYNVNWKLYWQLFYSRRDGKACVLCNILHADRRSLECHFKMVHCISEPCAKREPEVVTIEAEPSDTRPPKTSLDQTAVGGACRPKQPYPQQSESGQKDPQEVGPENIDAIEVLFEINHANAVECETSSATTPESLHLALASTSSEMELSPRSEGEVQTLSENVARTSSPCRTSQSKDENAGLVITDGMESSQLMTSSTTFAMLQPDDEVEELESDGMDLLSLSKSEKEGEVVTAAVQTKPASRENPEVIEIDGDDTVFPVGSSQRTGVQLSSVDFPPMASFPAESRHTRPTAVVNPFDEHVERCSASTDGCVRNIHGLPPSAMFIIPESSQATTDQRSAQSSPVPATFSSSSSDNFDLIAVEPDDDDSCPDESVSAPSSPCPLRDCRTPPHALGDVESELADKWSNRTAAVVSRELPDLSRLTPSKIAAFMNRDVFSAKHQSDIEKHFEEKALTEPSSSTSKEVPAEANSETISIEWDADSEGSRMSQADTASGKRQESMKSEPPAYDFSHSFLNSRSGMRTSLSSGEEDESLPFGFNIVNVESLLPKPLVSDQGMEERGGAEQPTRVRTMTGRSCEETGKRFSSGTRTRRKRTLSKTHDGDFGTHALTMNQTEEEHEELSPTRSKKSKNDGPSPPGEMQQASSGSKEVFKEPFGLCVGVIRPGSLVEVSTANVPRTSKARNSLDGMVMKVEKTDCSTRYFIHFPNMDKRLDRWVSNADIIQVYRTEDESTHQAASPVVKTSAPLDQAKRRLAFESAPEAQLSKNGNASDAAHSQPGTAASVRPPPKRSYREVIPDRGPAAASPVMKTSAPLDQAKRRLAFEPAPEAQLSKNVNASDAAHSQPGTAASVRSPPKRSYREVIPDRGPAVGRNRRPRDRLGRLFSIAKARLIQNRQQAKATSESQSQKTPRFRRPVKTGTRIGTAEQTNTDSSKLVSRRPRRMSSAASGAGVAQVCDNGAAANGDIPKGGASVSSKDVVETMPWDPSGVGLKQSLSVSRRQRARPVGSRKGADCAVNRCHSVKRTGKGGARETTAESVLVSQNSSLTNTAGGSNTAARNGGRTKIKKTRSHHLAKECPSGVTIHPVSDAMLDSLCPGVLVYVICTVLRSGWIRLVPAEIKEAPDRKRFYVRYLGFQSSHDEWVSSELIHSVMVVQEKIDPNKLKVSWRVKSSEQTSPNKPEKATKASRVNDSTRTPKAKDSRGGIEATPVSVTFERDRKTGQMVLSSDSKHLMATENSRGRDNVCRRRGSPTPREQEQRMVKTSRIVPKPRDIGRLHKLTKLPNLSNSPLEEPPPMLPRERPSRLPRDAPPSLPAFLPPPLAPEADHRVALATRRSTAMGGRSTDINLADNLALSGTVRMEPRPATSSGAARVMLRIDYATTPPVPLVRSTAPTVGTDMKTAAPSNLTPNSSADPCASAKGRRRGRPPKKSRAVEPTSVHPPLLDDNGAQPAGSNAQSCGMDLPPVAKRRGRPPKTSRVANATLPGGKLSAQPIGQPVGAEVPSAEKHSGLILEQFRVAQPGSSGVAQSDCRADQSDSTAGRPADSGYQSSGSAAPSDRSAAKSSIAVVPQAAKRGRPIKKFKAARLPSKDHEPSIGVLPQAAKRGRPLKKFKAARLPSKDHEPSIGVLPQAAKRGRPLKKFKAARLPSKDCEPSIAVVPKAANRGRPFKKFKAAKPLSKDLEQSASSTVQTVYPSSHVTDAQSAASATPSGGSVASTTGSAAPAIAKQPDKTLKKLNTSQLIDNGQKQSEASTEVNEERSQLRSLRSVSLRDAADLASKTVDIPTIPRTQKGLKRLKDGDVVYVIHEVKQDGTKSSYPAKILHVNKDLYYTRFFIHYLGWKDRYNEWVTVEVIDCIVDRSGPNFSTKLLMRREVPPPTYQEQLSAYGPVRPCSVDLSVNNICFFSALRKGQFSVDDKRIMALRAAAGTGGQNGD